MRKEMLRAMMVAAICAAVVFVCTTLRAQESGADDLPALEKGWNLISVPCTVRVGGLNRSVLRQLSYFTWDGEKYVRTSVLERGRGYIVDANQVVNTSSICENNRLPDPGGITLAKGWNLVGNPFHKSVPAADVLGEAATAVFEYRGNRFVQLEEGAHMKPWRGYWVFAEAETTIDIFEGCELRIAATGQDETDGAFTIEPGDELELSAEYSCTSGGETESTDVTSAMAWQIADGGVGSINENKYSAAEEGTASISAIYNEYESNTIEIEIKDPLLEGCAKLLVAFDETTYSDRPEAQGHYYAIGETGSGDQCGVCGGRLECRQDSRFWRQVEWGFSLKAFCVADGPLTAAERRDVTADVTWNYDKDFFYTVTDKAFHTREPGVTEVSAEYRSLKSEPLTVEVRDDVADPVEMIIGEDMLSCDTPGLEEFCEGADYLVVQGGNYLLGATGIFLPDAEDSIYLHCGGTLPGEKVSFTGNLTERGTWTISNESVVTVDRYVGLLRAASPGIAEVSVSFRDVTSEPVKIKVAAADELISLAIEPADGVKVAVGETKKLKVTGRFAGGKWDVTEEVEWTLTSAPEGAATIGENGLLQAGLRVATGTVSATFGEVVAEIPLEIVAPGQEQCDELKLVFHSADHSFAGGKTNGVRLYTMSEETGLPSTFDETHEYETCHTCDGAEIMCHDEDGYYKHSEYEPGTDFRVDAVCFKYGKDGETEYTFDVTDDAEWTFDEKEIQMVQSGQFGFTDTSQYGGYMSASYGEMKSGNKFAGLLGMQPMGFYPTNVIVTPDKDQMPCEDGTEDICLESEYTIPVGETTQLYFTGNYIYRQDYTEFISCSDSDVPGSGIYIEPRDISSLVEWGTNDSGIVEIGEDGRLEALAPGVATMFFWYKNQISYKVIYMVHFRVVTRDTVLSLKTDPAGSISLPVDSGTALKVIGEFIDGEKEVWDNVEWIVEGDNQNLVTFDFETVRAGSETGTVTVKAKIGDIESAPIAITVYDPVLEECESLKLVFKPTEFTTASGPGFYYYKPGEGEMEDAPAQCMSCEDRAAPYCWSGAGRNRAFLHEAGRDIGIRALCVKKQDSTGTNNFQETSRVIDISDKVQWTINDEALLEHGEGAQFKSLGAGRAVISAKYRTLESGQHFVDMKAPAGTISIDTETQGIECLEEYAETCAGHDLAINSGTEFSLQATLNFERIAGEFMTCAAGSGSEIQVTQDVTGEANWTISGNGVLNSSGGGSFSATGAGTESITAEWGGYTSTSFNVLVADKDQPITLTFDREEAVRIGYGQATGVKVFAHYLDRVEDVTETAGYAAECEGLDAPEDGVTVEKGTITGGTKSCDGKVIAMFKGIGAELALDTFGLTGFDRLAIEPSEALTMFENDSIQLKAYAYYGDEKHEVTQFAEWRLDSSSEDLATVEAGLVTAGDDAGSGTIETALTGYTERTDSELRSDAVSLTVIKGELVGVTIAPYATRYFHAGSSYQFRAMAVYKTAGSCPTSISYYSRWDIYSAYYPSCAIHTVDVTNYADWGLMVYSGGDAVYSGDDARISMGLVKAGSKTRHYRASAIFKGKQNYVYFYTYADDYYFSIRIDPSSSILARAGERVPLKAMGRYLSSESCVPYSPDGDDECEYSERDITDEVSWNMTSLSGTDTGEVIDGEYNAPDSEWAGYIVATHANRSSGRMLMQVKAGFVSVLLPQTSLYIQKGKTAKLKVVGKRLAVPYCDTLGSDWDHMCEYEEVDVTKEIEWTISDCLSSNGQIVKFGSVEEGVFTHNSECTSSYSYLKASYEGLYIGYQYVYPKDRYQELRIEPSYILMRPGAEAPISLEGKEMLSEYCYPYSSIEEEQCKYQVADLTEEATFDIATYSSNAQKFDMDGNKVIAPDTAAIGRVYAGIGNVFTNAMVNVQVGESIVVQPTSIYVASGSRISMSASIDTLASEYCDPGMEIGDLVCKYEKVDIAQKDVWKITSTSDGDPGRVEDGVFIAPDNDWSGYLVASYQGVDSSRIYANVKARDWFTVSLTCSVGWRQNFYGENICLLAEGQTGMLSANGVSQDGSTYADLSSLAEWEVQDDSVISVTDGKIETLSQGMTFVTAKYGDARSNRILVIVTSGSGGEYLVLAGVNHPVKVGEKPYYYVGHLDVKESFTVSSGSTVPGTGLVAKVTTLRHTDVDWKSSDPSVAEISSSNSSANYYTFYQAKSIGFTDVYAEKDGLVSNSVSLEVWDEREFNPCDDDYENKAVWTGTWGESSEIETSCRQYSQEEDVYVRYTALTESGGGNIQCLDVYILDEDGNKVKTLRENGCSNESLLTADTSAAKPIYQNLLKWNMTDNSGQKVGPGKYYAAARFYINYDPVVSVPFEIIEGEEEVGMNPEE